MPGCDTISIIGPGEKWKLNYKRYVEVPLDCEVQTVALFFYEKVHKIEQEVAEHEKKRIMADKLYCQGFDRNGQYFSGQSMDGL